MITLQNMIFANPQAYRVFPQIANPYNTGITDTAIFTGYIQVTDSNGTTKSFSNTDTIDFSGFSGIIDIDQYTDTGSVKLGRWNMPEGGLPKPIAAWSAAGKTNEDEDRAVLKDLTGNGHDITLNGFAFSGMSGYGGYAQNYNNIIDDVVYKSDNKIIINRQSGTTLFARIPVKNYNNIEYKILVDLSSYSNNYIKLYSYDILDEKDLITLYNGINIIPEVNTLLNGNICFKLEGTGEVIIEQIPEYPDALVFDGVDDYGICENLPKLNDYTFICKRIVFDGSKGAVASKGASNLEGAFVFEGGTAFLSNIFSFGSANITPNTNSSIAYQTKNSYNGTKINAGDVDDTTYINIGGFRWASMAFYCAYLFDRSLTEDEIKTFIRKNIDPSYLLPSEIPTPDCYYDFSLGSNDDANREIVKDQSGNGNDAKIYNCAFAGMSGYGGYVQTWLDKTTESDAGTIVVRNNSITFTPTSTSALNVGQSDNYLLQPTENYIKIKITGLKADGTSKLQINVGNGSAFTANYDGIYSIKLGSGMRNVFIKGVDNIVKLELLPEYEGALVLDGVDDYVKVEKQMPVFKTVFVVLKDLSTIDRQKYAYDGRNLANNGQLLNRIYYAAPANGTLFPNGVINKTYSTDLLKVIDYSTKVTITEDLTVLNIGSNTSNAEYSNIAIYKFLGFKEALNEDQIKAVIQKYNLLDRVDDIEVS